MSDNASSGSSASVSDNKKYPGNVTGKGHGLAYQRFLWKQLYSSIHATWFDLKYEDDIGDGHQLFLALSVGYRIPPFGGKFFIEPSVAVSHWPINKGLPASSEVKERKWSNYQFEPGMHIGIVF